VTQEGVRHSVPASSFSVVPSLDAFAKASIN
jgi:hypothetical protein